LRLASFTAAPMSVYNRAFAERCTDFNDSVLGYLKRADSPGIVVLGGNFAAFMWDKARLLEERQRVRPADLDMALFYLKRTVETLRNLGKRVVIVAPMPTMGVDIGRCSERLITRRLIAGPGANCETSVEGFHRWHGSMLELFTRMRREADTDVISFEDLLCGGGTCIATMEGKLLYRDEWHLTQAGSVLIARKSRLVDQVVARAR
jgi:hypothetical protein